MTEQEIKRFIDEYPAESEFDAEQVKFLDILNKDITVLDIAERIGGYGNYLIILAEDKGKKIQFITGSHVIMPKLKKAKEDKKLPLIIKFTQEENKEGNKQYYDIK